MTQLFELIASRSGLDFIAVQIFLQLDFRTFANLEMVCKSFHQLFKIRNLWREKLKIEDLLRYNEEEAKNSHHFRTLAWRLYNKVASEWKHVGEIKTYQAKTFIPIMPFKSLN